MKHLWTAAAVLLGAASLLPTSAHAALSGPVPTNAYITANGFDWAWGDPCAAAGVSCSDADLSTQSAYGWRIPTAAEMTLAPLATAFEFPGANVPLGGSDPVSGANFQYTGPNLTGAAACATPWFNDTYSHCDWGNGPGSGGTNGAGNGEVPWFNQPGYQSYSESLFIRDAAAVPEPITLTLIGTGLAGLALARRRRA